MKLRRRLLTAAAVAATALSVQPSRALVSLEDGKDHLYVDGSFEMAYDSNVFGNSLSGGSLTYSTTLTTELTRRAGWIGVNLSAELDVTKYASYRAQGYNDPRVSAELTKQTGRTTGSLTLSIQKLDRTDLSINTRDTSWVYDAGLNFQYPVIERYTVSGSFDANEADYTQHPIFTNLATYSANLYLYYILNEQRDLFVDYGYRRVNEATGEYDNDNSLKVGVSGRVIGPFNGSLQVGYSRRMPYDGPDHQAFDALSASGSMTWNITRRLGLTANVAKDFSTTATALNVDATTIGLTLQDSLSSKAVATLAADGGENRFLGVEGLTAPNNTARVDQFVDLSAYYSYAYNEHLKVQVGYNFYRSWSNVFFAEFARQQYHITLSSHW